MRNLIFIFTVLSLVIPCQARTITVDDDGPADFSNIQAAIDGANDGDEIIVADGTYTGDGNRDIDFLGKAVTVRSTNPNDPNIVAATIIDCNSSETEYHTGFYFDNGEDTNSVLEGLTVTNGYAGMGGAILCDNSSPTIANCVFRDNSSGFKGGGMYNTFFSSPTVTNCTFIANTSDKGGGMYNTVSSSPTVTNCTFRGNSAYSNGGGMHNFDDSNPTVNNCTFSGNSADRGGGMFNLYNSSPTVTNCTFSGNSANNVGGGMYNYSSSPPVTNCIIWGNTAPSGSQIYNDGTSSSTVSYSDVQGSWPGEGNINADPCFVEPGYWADANDPNIIVEPNDPNAIWVEGDYRLLAASPCIDAGDPNYAAGPNETDLDGKPRIVGGRIDMGAYEYELLPAIEVIVKISPKTLNLQSKGRWITCYIWLPEDYNVGDIDTNSILLEDEIEAERVWLGDEFAVVKFSRGAVQEMLGEVETPGEVELVVSGELGDGTIFEGADTIRVIDVGGGKNIEPPGKALKQLNRNRKRIKGP